jgi:MoaA/NifB/PqqE/SkfB family radical SAM enzyme
MRARRTLETAVVKPLLFLDIDGVLNSIQYAIRTKIKGVWGLDEDCVERLQRIVDATNCAIVVMSTWRRIHTLQEIADMLVEAGMYEPVPLIGITPVIRYGRGMVRGHEVREWLYSNSHKCWFYNYADGCNQYVRYVCVDDGTDFLPDQPLVRTDKEIGLTDENVVQCISHLLGRP